MAATKKARAVEFEGAQHTEASLAAMTTADIAQLVMRMRGESKPPKPATKARAIELLWLAAEKLPEAPQAETKTPEVPDARAEAPEDAAEVRGAEKQAPEQKARKAKRYSIAEGGSEAAERMLPQARLLVRSMIDAARPLTMVEVAGLLQVRRASKNPQKVVAWYFARVFRPAGILVERKGSEA